MSKYLPESDEVNPNLIPIMNLFTALIPFLLMSAVFYRLAVIQVSVPVKSTSGETDDAKEEDKITLNVQIFPDRFDLAASSGTIDPEVLKKLKTSVARPKSDDKGASLLELTKAAHQIKGDYIASDTAIVAPEGDIAYEVVIAAVDAIRYIKIERDGQLSKISLFSRVVLSGRNK